MGRQILNKIQGVKKIIDLLDSKDNDVCRNASWTLSSAAVHKSIVLEACHMGVIEALLKLTHSISISSFADDALGKILKHRKLYHSIITYNFLISKKKYIYIYIYIYNIKFTKLIKL